MRLEPLALRHVPKLFRAGGGDREVWRWLSTAAPGTEAEMRAFVGGRVRDVAEGRRVAFAVVEAVSGGAIGMTGLHSWGSPDGRIELGGTWFGRSWWRTAANTETKLLVLGHAFDALGFGTVVWRIDVGNVRSQQAIGRIGARLEGCTPGGLLRADGTRRDVLVYTMDRADWPAARTRLVERLSAGRRGPAGG
ncbi:GNAT family N-acetyltransferase [Kitasatospora sp. NPDC002522]